MDKPFKKYDGVEWFVDSGVNKPQRFRGYIVDGYYQQKTHNRKEGWRVSIRLSEKHGSNKYREKYLDEVKLVQTNK